MKCLIEAGGTKRNMHMSVLVDCRGKHKKVVERIKLTLDLPLLVSPMTAIMGRSM